LWRLMSASGWLQNGGYEFLRAFSEQPIVPRFPSFVVEILLIMILGPRLDSSNYEQLSSSRDVRVWIATCICTLHGHFGTPKIHLKTETEPSLRNVVCFK
jgi:hypothetical protein